MQIKAVPGVTRINWNLNLKCCCMDKVEFQVQQLITTFAQIMQPHLTRIRFHKTSLFRTYFTVFPTLVMLEYFMAIITLTA